MIPNLKPDLNDLIKNISAKNNYYGNRISPSIMKMFEIVEDDTHIGIMVPYWLGVIERGRGPRKSNKSSGLVKIIYAWMQKHNLFTARTEKGKFNEARSVTWYLNKYGNKQFRNKVFIDVYKTERQRTIDMINQKFALSINEITMQVL